MCPEVTYDKNMDRTREKYYFQLFDSRDNTDIQQEVLMNH